MSQGSMAQTAPSSVAVNYNMDVVRWGALATVFWGVIGFFGGRCSRLAIGVSGP